ncbi:unnamed protein product [Trifolium pratense]|uniref:Uncharacterized protein n=1 Tax=Trifolium pratense TaxID=57577 RepID=A0ACB0LH54_TRIPR|nr:unnamed protein product [Trifolium pratense]
MYIFLSKKNSITVVSVTEGAAKGTKAGMSFLQDLKTITPTNLEVSLNLKLLLPALCVCEIIYSSVLQNTLKSQASLP